METVTVLVDIPEDGHLTYDVPASFKGSAAMLTLTKQEMSTEPVDEYGWPLGFWDKIYGSITDPSFQRPPQGEADPLPKFE